MGNTRGRRATALAMVLAATVALTGCWEQVGGNAGRTRANAVERALTVEDVDALEEAWSADLPLMVSEPIVRGGRVIVNQGAVGSIGGEVTVRAFDARTGAPAWATPTARNQFFLIPPVTSAGDELWQPYIGYPTPEDPCPEIVDRIDPATGALLGRLDVLMFGPPASAAGVIASGESRFESCAVGPVELAVRDRDTRERLWSAPLLEPGEFRAVKVFSPAVADGRILVGYQAALRAFSAGGCGSATCAPRWVDRLDGVGGQGEFVNVAAARDRVVATASWCCESPQRRELRVYDAGSGRLAGTVPDVDAAVPPAIAGDLVYAVVEPAAGPPALVAVPWGCEDAGCAPAWSMPLAREAAGGLAVAGGVVYVGVAPDGDGVGGIAAIDADGCGAATCHALRTIPVDGSPSAISVSGGRLFTNAGGLTAFAPTGGPGTD